MKRNKTKKKLYKKTSGNSNHEISICKALETDKVLSPSVLIRATTLHCGMSRQS